MGLVIRWKGRCATSWGLLGKLTGKNCPTVPWPSSFAYDSFPVGASLVVNEFTVLGVDLPPNALPSCPSVTRT